jgi:hypothetical protein
MYEPFVYPFLGFWLALAAVLLLSVSYFRSTEHMLLTRRSLMIVVLVLLLISGMLFFFTNELEFQTQVTKLMDVQKKAASTELLGNPEIWKVDFARIMAVAEIFRAQVRYNSPNYYYCELEVPVISYRILLGIYDSMGYYAQEPIFFMCLTKERAQTLQFAFAVSPCLIIN